MRSDGWRKSYCMQGTPLTNLMALVPNKALFYDVMDIRSLQKDGDGISVMLLDVASNSNDPKSLIGFVLNNTKTNHKAMRILVERFPHFINRGCLAHGLASAMKYFAHMTKATCSGTPKRSFGLQWLYYTIEVANKMANFLKHSAQAKKLVRPFCLVHCVWI
jgi:hypothetical protein